MEDIAALTMLVGLLVASAALVCLIKPISRLGMPTRARAFLGLGLGFAIFVVGDLMMPTELSVPTSQPRPQTEYSVPIPDVPDVSETALHNAEFLEPQGRLLDEFIRNEYGTDPNAQTGPGIGVTREDILDLIEGTRPEYLELQWGDVDEYVMADGSGTPLDAYAFDYGGPLHVNWLKIAAQPNGDWSRDASLVYLSVTLLPGEDQVNIRAVETMGELISTVIPEWRESIDWLYNAIDSSAQNASNTAYGRRIVVGQIKPTRIRRIIRSRLRLGWSHYFVFAGRRRPADATAVG